VVVASKFSASAATTATLGSASSSCCHAPSSSLACYPISSSYALHIQYSSFIFFSPILCRVAVVISLPSLPQSFQ